MDAGLQEQLNDLRRRLIALNSQNEKADNLAAPGIEMNIKNVQIAITHLEAEIEKNQPYPESDSQK
jgi:hypothetical protein